MDSGLFDNADALWNARSLITTPLILCVNGDTIINVDFNQLVLAHIQSEALATLVASNRTDQPHPGAVEVRAGRKVVDIHEWAQDSEMEVSISQYSNACSNSGVYILDFRRLMQEWSEQERKGKLEQGLFRTLAKKNELYAYDNEFRYLIDIGTPERLCAARSSLATISEFIEL
jgi:NDP-sugar pyrophosphorylase family protein